MKLQLIEGYFETSEALDILTRLIQVKINFHESKIVNQSSEEDIKMREKKIKQLQKELFEIRREIEKTSGRVCLESTVHLTKATHGKPAAV